MHDVAGSNEEGGYKRARTLGKNYRLQLYNGLTCIYSELFISGLLAEMSLIIASLSVLNNVSGVNDIPFSSRSAHVKSHQFSSKKMI